MEKNIFDYAANTSKNIEKAIENVNRCNESLEKINANYEKCNQKMKHSLSMLEKSMKKIQDMNKKYQILNQKTNEQYERLNKIFEEINRRKKENAYRGTKKQNVALGYGRACQILDLPEDTPVKEFEKEYWNLSKKVHPDLNHENKEENTEKFILFTQAIEVIREYKN